MTKAASFTEADVRRAISGAVKSGWPVGSFKVRVEKGLIELLPCAPVTANAADAPEGVPDELASWRARRGG